MRQFATIDGRPAVYDDEEAWVVFHRKIGGFGVNLAWALQKAQPMTEAEFRQTFPDLPPAPEFPETAEQCERLLSQFNAYPRKRELIERTMADHPGLSAAEAIDI